MIVPIVSIARHNMMTPERADAFATSYEKQQKFAQEEYGATDDTISISVVDSVVVIMSYSQTNLRDIARLFEMEGEHRDAEHLIAGRFIRPSRQSREEDSGILAGID